MARKQSQKQIDKAIDERITNAYNIACDRITVPMMKLPTIYAVGRQAILDGADDLTLQAKIRAYVDTIKTQ